MTKAYRTRFLILLLALVGMAGVSVGIVQQSWQRFDSLERRLSSGLLESFHLAYDFEARLHQLNYTMLRYAARREPAAVEEFQKASMVLNWWIDRHDPRSNKDSNLTTEAERRLLRQINDAYDDYLRAAGSVLTNRPPAGADTLPAPLDRFEEESQKLLHLGDQLADAHRRAQDAFLHESNEALGVLRGLVIATIVAMLLLVGALGVVVYRDLIAPLRTKLIQSEELLAKQEKLATLGTLAAGIAHEIRNPLTSLKARLYTLGKHIRGNVAGLADAEVISAEIGRLERIIQDVLSFARPSEPQVATVRADAPLAEVHSLMAGALAESGVRLVLEAGPDALVSTDVALIKQVLINLVRNGAEAIEGPGTVTLRVRTDRLPLHGSERDVALLEVTDTGRGIPAHVEQRLFDPFFTTKDAGTGLGLSIAMRIVDKCGGALQYQTQVGRGTTFAIVLPRVGPPANESANPAAQP